MLNFKIPIHFWRRNFIGLIFLLYQMCIPQNSLYCFITLLLYFPIFGYLSHVFFFSQPTTNTKKIFFFLNLQGSPAMGTIVLGVHTDFTGLCIKLCINSKELLSLFHFLNNYSNHASSSPNHCVLPSFQLIIWTKDM